MGFIVSPGGLFMSTKISTKSIHSLALVRFGCCECDFMFRIELHFRICF
jgi:hypothetical protein